MGHKNALAEPLGLVQSPVGRSQQLNGGFAVIRRACAANAYPDMERYRKPEIKWLLDAGNDAFGSLPRLV